MDLYVHYFCLPLAAAHVKRGRGGVDGEAEEDEREAVRLSLR